MAEPGPEPSQSGQRHFGHSNRYVVIFYCCVNLNFPNDRLCAVSFYMLTGISSLVKCLLRSLANFLIGLFVFFLLRSEFFA